MTTRRGRDRSRSRPPLARIPQPQRGSRGGNKAPAAVSKAKAKANAKQATASSGVGRRVAQGVAGSKALEAYRASRKGNSPAVGIDLNSFCTDDSEPDKDANARWKRAGVAALSDVDYQELQAGMYIEAHGFSPTAGSLGKFGGCVIAGHPIDGAGMFLEVSQCGAEKAELRTYLRRVFDQSRGDPAVIHLCRKDLNGCQAPMKVGNRPVLHVSDW